VTETPALPGCYRHPQSPTGITCTRCDRPICAQCMVAAPVGFQCPECVAGAQATQRRAVTVAGGSPISRPVITYALIGINVALYGLQTIVPNGAITNNWSMWPAGIAYYGEWWRLMSGAFLHGSIMHILFNMYVLYALGPTLERILGHARYLALYLVAALGGAVASYLFTFVCTPSVGASGAIFGLMGALVVAGRRLRYDITQVLVLLAINLVIGFISPNVDWRAHIGGLIVGALVAAVFVWAPHAHRLLWQSAGVSGIVVVLVLLAIWRTSEIMTNELWRVC
jgi:membrane associated rhomboid family serine protease